MTRINNDSNSTKTVSKKDAEKAAKLAAKKANELKAKTIYQQAIELSDAITTRDVRSDVKDFVKSQKDKLTKEEYKALKKQAGVGFFNHNFRKQNEYAIDDYRAHAKDNVQDIKNSTMVYLKGVKTDATDAKSVTADYVSAIKNDKNLTENQAEVMLKQVKNGKFKKAVSWLGYSEESEVQKMEAAKAARNRVNQNRAAVENGSEIEMTDLAKAVMKKMGLSGTKEDILKLYDIGDKVFGTDAIDNYSDPKTHIGENSYIRGFLGQELRSKDPDAKLEATDDEIAAMFQTLGYDVDPEFYAGHAVGWGTAGALSGGTSMIMRQRVNAKDALGHIHVKQVVNPAAAVLGTVEGIALAIGKDKTRSEHRISEIKLDDSIKTTEDFYKFADDVYKNNPEYGALIKDFASQFEDENGNLKKEELHAALEKAAGNWSVLNPQEVALSEPKAKAEPVVAAAPAAQVEDTPCDPIKLESTYMSEGTKTNCHTVKAGEYWDAIIAERYQVTNRDDIKAIRRIIKDAYYEKHKDVLNKKGITSSKGNFGPKAGEDLCIPQSITVNNHKYTFHEDKTNVRTCTDRTGGMGVSLTNPFEYREIEIERYKDCDGNITERPVQ